MADETSWPGAGGAPDAADVLDAVLTAARLTADQAVVALQPVLDPDGSVADFRVVGDSGLISRLAGAASRGRTLRELLPPASAERMIATNARVLAGGVLVRDETVLAAGDDGLVPVLTDEPRAVARLAEVARIPVGGLVVLLGRDVTQARAAERALAASEERYRLLVEHSSDPIVVVADGRVRYASPAVRVVLHREPDDLVGAPLRCVAHPDDATALADLAESASHAPAGASRTGRLRTLGPDGVVGWIAVTATSWLEDPAVGGVVLNIRDVTEQHEAQLRLQREALQDPLTGLPNRRAFLRSLTAAASRSERTGAPFAVLLMDVDDFKRVNDSLGHAAGDDLLAELASRLTHALRPSDSAARLGGDELVVVAEGLHGPGDARALARRVLECCSGDYRLGGVLVPVTVSVGVATSRPAAVTGAAGPRPRVDAERVLGLADAALYEAKRRGRHRIEESAPDGAGEVRDR
ncbi:sensor domain-containing diguanylate cyclase [uncultured Cellulomonas sp.]|uniref:sensor domain-containing diguanylate cyclase n=1 Tax=uncultured Cellulomonas sp. TaxID=189682 RepID=UPI0026204859|nr:sensor domain-containing diguanylate cyclase [uncultured Cellulomonas sp.]